jgi:hypothetical protein
MEREDLFLRDFEELGECVSSADPYVLLRAAAIVRRLLLDGGNSLVEQLNRKHKLKLRYRISVPPPWPAELPKPAMMFLPDGLYPTDPMLPLWTTSDCTRDEFLATRVVEHDGDVVSVQELVKFLANVAGGVHAGQNVEGKEEKLLLLNKNFQIADVPIIAYHMRGVGMVVRAGVLPLLRKVVEDLHVSSSVSVIAPAEERYVADALHAAAARRDLPNALGLARAVLRTAPVRAPNAVALSNAVAALGVASNWASEDDRHTAVIEFLKTLSGYDESLWEPVQLPQIRALVLRVLVGLNSAMSDPAAARDAFAQIRDIWRRFPSERATTIVLRDAALIVEASDNALALETLREMLAGQVLPELRPLLAQALEDVGGRP